MTEQQVEGQMSIFDLDIWSGKMSPEPLVATTEKTSSRSSKRPQKSRIKMPLYLDLRGGGLRAEPSWETGGALHGAFTMHSFGECPNEERESRLSQILEERPLPKYSLSAKACRGILRRAKARGKELPEILEAVLTKQSAFSNELDVTGGVKEYSSNTNEPEHSQHSTISPSCGCHEEKTFVIEGNGSSSIGGV